MKWVKLLIVGLVVAGLLFFLITRPVEAGDAVQGVIGAILAAFGAIGTFFQSLVS